ncbi:MAG: heme NO-binding domain-containing protein, partial [Actinobacteria bacterium]|nr:heme NO-binding domain-containing protein [Actinomycetota bacterium]
MKGVIFNLLEQVVTDAHGEAAWNALLDDAGLDGVYAAVGSYPDADLLALVEAGSKRLGVEQVALVRWFGEAALPLLADRYPEFFESHTSLFTFLPTLNDVIHAEVRKLYPEADVPEFGFVATGGEAISMDYRSPRRLCALAEGFVVGAARHFGEEV